MGGSLSPDPNQPSPSGPAATLLFMLLYENGYSAVISPRRFQRL
jgi:hypothetical protein